MGESAGPQGPEVEKIRDHQESGALRRVTGGSDTRKKDGWGGGCWRRRADAPPGGKITGREKGHRETAVTTSSPRGGHACPAPAAAGGRTLGASPTQKVLGGAGRMCADGGPGQGALAHQRVNMPGVVLRRRPTRRARHSLLLGHPSPQGSLSRPRQRWGLLPVRGRSGLVRVFCPMPGPPIAPSPPPRPSSPSLPAWDGSARGVVYREDHSPSPLAPHLHSPSPEDS